MGTAPVHILDPIACAMRTKVQIIMIGGRVKLMMSLQWAPRGPAHNRPMSNSLTSYSKYLTESAKNILGINPGIADFSGKVPGNWPLR